MAFLDNSGDIILDAVLTDTGRFRLAKGDGTFRIVKFSFADDEINYGNYDKTNASGSAYYDLSILQTPVLEAFTNNTSTMKSKLISIPRTNLLYLPTVKINSLLQNSKTQGSTGAFFVTTNTSTSNTFSELNGVLDGITPDTGASIVRIDQGLDTSEISPLSTIDSDLLETQYVVQLDNRLGQITDTNGAITQPSFIDDDNIAHYYLSQGEGVYVNNIEAVSADAPQKEMVIAGPRGTKLELKIKGTVELESSDYLFTKLGSSGTLSDLGGTSYSINFIDTIMRVMGATTGASIDVPLRFIKRT
tara:strand:+ start:522 stop:1433 length:912 start_codon:yes stop_codon:yes gene_type:complete